MDEHGESVIHRSDCEGVQIDGSWSLYMGIEMILHKTTFERRGIQMGMPTKADINQYTFDQVDISNIYIYIIIHIYIYTSKM